MNAATAAWYVAGTLTAWSFGHAVVAAGDLWWHVATGRLMLEQRAIPLVDSLSYTREGQPWLQHEWLADLVFAMWDRALAGDRAGIDPDAVTKKRDRARQLSGRR